jgi:hypothetical protein
MEIPLGGHAILAGPALILIAHRRKKEPRGAGLVRAVKATAYFWCKQAASYCETLAVLREFCGCVPAYLLPATPSSLKADPRADAA